jgi:mono/diheme cytochrome c family protein
VNTKILKQAYTISALIFCSVLFKCTSQKKTEYDIPSHVPAENKKLLIERAEKGKVLYKLYCSGCHGIFTKGKDGVPNFTKIQIDNYHATALIGLDQNNHAVAKKMSSQQIDYVVTFLRLRKID